MEGKGEDEGGSKLKVSFSREFYLRNIQQNMSSSLQGNSVITMGLL